MSRKKRQRTIYGIIVGYKAIELYSLSKEKRVINSFTPEATYYTVKPLFNAHIEGENPQIYENLLRAIETFIEELKGASKRKRR